MPAEIREDFGAEALGANLKTLEGVARCYDGQPLALTRTPLGRWIVTLGATELADKHDVELAVIESLRTLVAASW